MGWRGPPDLSGKMPVTATEIMCTFAFGLLLHPKEPAVAGHMGDCRDGDKELRGGGKDVPQCQGDLGLISASQGCLGLSHHDIAVAKHAILPHLTGKIQFQGEAKPGLGVLVGQQCCLWVEEEEQGRAPGYSCTGEGGTCPRQEGLQQGFLMNRPRPGCPYCTRCFIEEQGSCADERQVFRAYRCHPDVRSSSIPPGKRHQLLWLSPLWSCLQPLHREQGHSERQYKYHTSPLVSRTPPSQANPISKKVDKYLLRKALPGLAWVQADG